LDSLNKFYIIMPIESASVKYTFDQLSKQGKAYLKVHFPNATVTEPKARLSRKASKDAPFLSLSTSAVKSKDAKYIAVAIDLDAPFPSLPVLGPICHGIQTDLQASGEPDSDGFVKLEATGVDPVISYVGPNPPPLSGPHRYVFMVWEQPEGSGAEAVRKALGLTKEAGISARVRWDEDGFEKKVGLSNEPLAGNYFVAN
jgi:phosphatidylethanolamine-binding protein